MTEKEIDMDALKQFAALQDMPGFFTDKSKNTITCVHDFVTKLATDSDKRKLKFFSNSFLN